MDLLGAEPFATTFGKSAVRKRPKVTATSVEELATVVDKEADAYSQDKDSNIVDAAKEMEARTEVSDPMFSKGQSKRIWGELYKVRGDSARRASACGRRPRADRAAGSSVTRLWRMMVACPGHRLVGCDHRGA